MVFDTALAHNSVGVKGFFYLILFIYWVRRFPCGEWYGLEGGLWCRFGVSSMYGYYIFTQKQKRTRTEQGPQVDSENV